MIECRSSLDQALLPLDMVVMTSPALGRLRQEDRKLTLSYIVS